MLAIVRSLFSHVKCQAAKVNTATFHAVLGYCNHLAHGCLVLITFAGMRLPVLPGASCGANITGCLYGLLKMDWHA